jgi:hypothetical protein
VKVGTWEAQEGEEALHRLKYTSSFGLGSTSEGSAG